jgi:transposase
MLITVALSVEEYTELEKLAQFRANMDSETLLRCVVGDLVDSNYTGGSDERMYAHQWLDRRFGIERYAHELADERRAQKKNKAASRPLGEIPDYFDKLVAKKGGQI